MSKGKKRILVVDVGGTHVKCAVSGGEMREFVSGPSLTPKRMTRQLLAITRDWRFDAVSIGYPGVVCEVSRLLNRATSHPVG